MLFFNKLFQALPDDIGPSFCKIGCVKIGVFFGESIQSGMGKFYACFTIIILQFKAYKRLAGITIVRPTVG